MKSNTSKRFVVDASVVKAAGETEHPVSSASRKWLNDILDICHRVVITKELSEEWQKHQSSLARKWLTSMTAKRKHVKIIETAPPSLKYGNLSEKEILAIQKDLPLISAALSIESDHIILTLDKKIRELVRKSNPKLETAILWLHAVEDSSERISAKKMPSY